MELFNAITLGHELMTQHGLIERGWSFKLDNSVRRFGLCSYRRKCISLSKNLIRLNTPERVQNTILHEIAHAIAGSYAGHGPEWKAVCVRIGAKPERCYNHDDTETPKLRYFAICGNCGFEHQRVRKIDPLEQRACKCQSGKPFRDMIKLEFKQRY